jgi:ABC-2 type transport system ATP-binding protein
MDAINISNLSKEYASGLLALDNVSLTIKKGDFFALLGPNGAGKSTTIGILTSLVRKTSGTVKIFDVDIDTDFAKAKSYIGIVPQEFNFNIFEKVKNILITQAGYYGVSRAQAEITTEKLLNELGLWEKRNVGAGMLSGGMKRRLMIARALVHNPQLLILDEPTAGVDIELRRTMYAFLRKINQEEGVTIILTTHYLEEAEQLCKNIAIIDQGKIIENTDIKTLINKLDVELFILDIKTPLQQLPFIENYQVKLVDETTLEVAVPKDQAINQLFLLLSQHNIEVISFRNKTNRLEEMFLRLTSQK